MDFTNDPGFRDLIGLYDCTCGYADGTADVCECGDPVDEPGPAIDGDQ